MRFTNGALALSGTITASTNGAAFHLPAGNGSFLVGVHVSAASGTTPTLNVKLQDSPDATTWTDVAGAASAQLTAAGNTVFAGRSTKAYVRAVATLGGTTPSFTVDVTAFGATV